MDPADCGLAEAAAVAQSLLKGPVDAIDRIRGGRNSRVYRVRRGGECFAVKHYPRRDNDSRDRLKTEFGALLFMERHGINAVPRALAIDPERRYALLSWIDGNAIEVADESDIDLAATFLVALHGLAGVAGSELQPLGAEACLSGIEVVAQLGRRLARLGCVAGAEPGLAELLDPMADFLFSTVLPKVTTDYRLLGLSFARPLPIGSRSLCPSDFGFHNALRGAAGLTFIDFEYFGWDDPVKLACDFLLHPGMRLPSVLKQRFVRAILYIYGADPTFASRLRMLYPLFALRWCLILLNEFLPERWAYRLHASQAPDWQKAKERQLALASELLACAQSNGGSLFYGQ
ncbi:MAG: aminoglycoside phosphotransferase family protein [Alphaproteobacteria bacterium]|nr:aminoglycoside phosphotransferase family protein [Alphaproteobacteria bacterium]